MRLLVIILGSFFAYMPKIFAAITSYLLGTLIYFVFSKRRQMMLSNLHHAFPNKTESWRKKIAKKSCCRMVEMGLFLISSPFFSKRRIQKILTVDDFAKSVFAQSVTYPQLFLLPHFSLTEAIALYRATKEGQAHTRESGVVFRPLNNPSLNKHVQKSRERLGLKLLSRKEGFSEAINILKANGSISLLFDQNAGAPGILGSFLGRLASTTSLPDLLAQKTNAKCFVAYAQRKAFWKAQIHIEPLPNSTAVPLRISANSWLENKLQENDNYCADWLWFHNRWKTQSYYSERYKINTKKIEFNLSQLEDKTRLWFRMPNWLGDVIMALPLIRAVKKARPDAEITLLVQKPFVPLLQKLNIADKIIELPKKDWKYFSFFRNLKKNYPDTQFLFTNSERGDFEAWLIHAPQRFGMKRPKKRRPLLTNTWKIPQALDETLEHQTHVWAQAMHYFGLEDSLDLSNFKNLFLEDKPHNPPPTIGLICGTENNPEKRWPIQNWRELIDSILIKYPNYKVHLYGTLKDKTITEQVALNFDKSRVIDLAGTTNLISFTENLTRCTVLICNDTGGMHLANAVGTPLIAIFGPTNPIRTGPIFEGHFTILQPFGCPKTGGRPIASIQSSQVNRALEDFLSLDYQ